jgi:hypothetical protein
LRRSIVDAASIRPQGPPEDAFAHPDTNLADIARPFAWIAAVAFLTGFLLSLAAHLGQVAGAHDAAPILRPTIVGAAPHGTALNLRKTI